MRARDDACRDASQVSLNLGGSTWIFARGRPWLNAWIIESRRVNDSRWNTVEADAIVHEESIGIRRKYCGKNYKKILATMQNYD